MTVDELIRELQSMPGEAVIVIDSDPRQPDGGLFAVDSAASCRAKPRRDCPGCWILCDTDGSRVVRLA